MKQNQRRMIACGLAAALGGVGGAATAGGFGIATQSGSGTGNAFAGGAAAAEDASVVWFNPAAMTALPSGKQAAVALHVLKPSFKFQNQGSTGAFAAPGTGEGGDGGGWNYVPNAFFSMDLGAGWRAGIALNSPFGLSTRYDAGWRGQLTAIKSDIKTLNVNPAVAYKVNDVLSVGAGVSAQKIQAELSSFSGAAALGNANLKADDYGFGFNLGATMQLSPSTRIGASYRSSIKYTLEGDATFTGPAGAPFNGNINADLRVPDSLSLSAFHALNRQWEFMADITRTGWHSVQALNVMRTTTSAGGAAGSTFTTLPFLWRNTWRYSAGANYRVSDPMKLRVGIAHDQTPTNDTTRTPRLPDQSRTWLAVGVQYRVSKSGVLEVGYAHEFVRDASINVALGASRLIGQFDDKADIFSVQYSHAF